MMRPARDWDEDYILFSLPVGEFDWFEAKGRRGLDLTLPHVKESDVRENLSRALSAFANTGGGVLIFGLCDPKPAEGRLHVDDGGIPTTLGKKGDTREWLDSIIPELVDAPLKGFNVYPVLPKGDASEISVGRALYLIDIPDSDAAPHQAGDHRYYARVGGRSRPIGHRLVLDIMQRRQHPRIELSFEIRSRLENPDPYQVPPPDRFGRRQPAQVLVPRLYVTARNAGRVLARYVNADLHLPVEIVTDDDLEFSKISRVFGSGEHLTFNEDNTRRDVVDVSGLHEKYGPSWFDPVLPGRGHTWEIELQADFRSTLPYSPKLEWTVYADNAAPVSGEILVSQIPGV